MIKIISINTGYAHKALAPYYLKANCSHEDIVIAQINGRGIGAEEIFDIVMIGDPKIIAFSCYIFNITKAKAVASMIKEKCGDDKIVIFGGPEVSFDATSYEMADYVIVGEGELSFDSLLTDIKNNRHSDKVVIGKPMEIGEIKSPYIPDYIDDIDGKIVYFEASRGCVFDCAYCMSGKTHLRKFSLEYVAAELSKLEGKYPKVVKFIDRTFNADRTFSNSILEYIINNSKINHLSYHFEIAGDLISDRMLEIVGTARKGLFQWEIGIQSYNEHTLQSVCRKSDLPRLTERVSRLVAMENCHIHTDLIAGLPYESYDSFAESFDRVYSLGADMLQLGFLKVLKGSRLREQIEQWGGYEYNKTPPYEIISTPYITQEELDKLRDIEWVVDNYHNTCYFYRALRKFVISPFTFYSGLADYVRDIYDDAIPEKLGLDDKYKLILGYITKIGNNKSLVISTLKLDYILANSSRTLPSCLKEEYSRIQKSIIKTMTSSNNYYATNIGINPYNGNEESGIVAIEYSDEGGRIVDYIKI